MIDVLHHGQEQATEARANPTDGGNQQVRGTGLILPCSLQCFVVGVGSLTPERQQLRKEPRTAREAIIIAAAGPHTQVFFAAGVSSRPRGPSIPPVSDCTCRSAELASSAGPELSPSLPGLCALACRNADSDPREVSHCRSVSPLGFSPPSPRGLPFDAAVTGLLPPPVPPFGFSPLPPEGVVTAPGCRVLARP